LKKNRKTVDTVSAKQELEKLQVKV